MLTVTCLKFPSILKEKEARLGIYLFGPA